MDINKVSHYINQIDEITKRPEKYLSVQEDQAEIIKSLIKNLYNFTKQKERNSKKAANVLEKLIITNMDEEQIWQQVELQNSSVCDSIVHDIAYLLAKKNSLKFPIKEKKEKNISSDVGKQKNEVEVKKNKSYIKDKMKEKIRKTESSVVDDKFFKLNEMTNFLKKLEEGEDIYESEDEIDYFEEEGFSDLDDNNDKQLHYKDFFDEPEEENFDENSESNSEVHFNKQIETQEIAYQESNDKYSDNEELEDSEISEKSENDFEDNLNLNNTEDIEEEINNVTNKMNDEDGIDKEEYVSDECNSNEITEPSTFEVRQKRLKTRIKNLEEEALKEKPWQLKGEVTAGNRPQNSLLEEYVEFDIATRPAPVLTEKSTLKLEDIIIQRIKDKAWDDVVRKTKPIENNIEYKKKLVLNQEKSKLSLAQIYEQEYLKQLENKNEEIDISEVEPPEHQEIRIMMNKLFYKLDALSNFHFTPKQVQPEAKIVSNLPALSMEEVAPVATTDATLLAPEEVKPKPKGNLIGKSERTATDKKRERRQKKLKQKLKFKEIEAKAKLKFKTPEAKNLQNKKISPKLLQKITKSNNVIQTKKSESDKYLKSSTTFFSKLQNATNSKTLRRDLDVKKQLGKKPSTKKSSNT